MNSPAGSVLVNFNLFAGSGVPSGFGKGSINGLPHLQHKSALSS